MAKSKNYTTASKGIYVEGSDDVYVHSVPLYLQETFEENKMSLEEYQDVYPNAPIYSAAYLAMKAKKSESIQSSMTTSAAKVTNFPGGDRKEIFADVFDLGDAAAAKNARGEKVRCTVLADPKPEFVDWVPEKDPNYIFPIDALKAVMVAAELNMPMLLWGMHGTGKTTLIEQYCNGTNQGPAYRVDRRGSHSWPLCRQEWWHRVRARSTACRDA